MAKRRKRNNRPPAPGSREERIQRAMEGVRTRPDPKTHPTSGVCRHPNCDDTYTRKTGGRNGLCQFHYAWMLELIEEDNATWEELDERMASTPSTQPAGKTPEQEARFEEAMRGEKPALTESELEDRIRGIAKDQGAGVLRVPGHIKPAGGLPDLVVFLPSGRVLFRELKSADGKLEPSQADHFPKMISHRCDVAVWRPEDLNDGHIEKEISG